MNFAYDQEHNFYYYGDESPTGKTYRQYLLDPEPTTVSIDVETISLKERIAIGVSIAVPHVAFYWPLFPTESNTIPWQLLKNPAITKIFHNAMFDLVCLREYEIDNTNIRDTSVQSRLLCHRFNSLSDLTYLHQMEVHDAGDFLKERNATRMLEASTEDVARKCMQDSLATYKLYQVMLPETDLPYFLTEMAVIPVLIKMSFRGLLIDQEYRQDIQGKLEIEVTDYTAMCTELGFNPGSNQQVGYILAKRGAYNVFNKLPFTRGRGKRSLSTAEKTLDKMADPLAQIILDYREARYLLGHYIEPWSHEERATTRFHLNAITGRPSSTDRNMQNIPGKFRKDGSEYPFNCRGCLLPDNGIFTDVDFSQIEPRILAYLSGDKEMQYIFSLPRLLPDGSKNLEADIHQQAAIAMEMDRKFAKQFNLAMTYGATDQGLMDVFKIKDIGRIRHWRSLWSSKFPQAADWIHSVQEDALVHGRAKTVFGREIRLPTLDEESPDGIQRKAVDYPCQASAAEVMKRGLIKYQDEELALTIHDEYLVDGFVPADKFRGLEDIAPFHTPVEVKYLGRWE